MFQVYIADNQFFKKNIRIDIETLILKKKQLQQQLNYFQIIFLKNTEQLEQIQRNIIFFREAQETLIKILKN